MDGTVYFLFLQRRTRGGIARPGVTGCVMPLACPSEAISKARRPGVVDDVLNPCVALGGSTRFPSSGICPAGPGLG